MHFGHDDTTLEFIERLNGFMAEHVYPAEATAREQIHANVANDSWEIPAVISDLKIEAQSRGLWNLFLPGEGGAGLTNLQYAPLAEIMGRSIQLAPPATNCAAPDTGNMEVLNEFGTDAQKEQWLKPLMAGEIRSAFAMTDRARWRRIRDQRTQMVDHRSAQPERQSLHPDGQDRPQRFTPPTAVDDPRATRYARG